MMAGALVSASCSTNNTAEEATADIIGKSQIVTDKMTPELLQELGKVGDLQVSPDGSKVLFGVGYTSVKQNRGNRELKILDLNKAITQITNTPKGEQNAVWSLDGQSIFFLYPDADGNMQMWKMNADGSNRQQLSSLDRSIDGFVLSPDQKSVIVISTIPVQRIEEKLFEGLDKTTGRLWDEMGYRHWDDFVNDTPHPYIAQIGEDGKVAAKSFNELTDILEGEPYECPTRPFGGTEDLVWSPDGKYIAYSCRKETGTKYAFSTRTSIYLYDVAKKTTFDIHPEDHGYDNNPQFSKDGSQLSFMAMARNGYESDQTDIIVVDMAKVTEGSKAFKNVTANYDNNVNSYTWNPDGKGFTFSSYSYGTERLVKVDMEGKTSFVSPDDDYDYDAVCYAGDKLLTLRHDYHHPNEIFEICNGQALQLGHENDELIAQLGDMGKVEKRWMKSANGDDLCVWVAYPAGYKEGVTKNVPTLLFCEGGPESAVTQFWSTRWNIAIMQANGYAVVLPNRHGVPGFGQKYMEQIAGDFNGLCMKDYFTAIDNIAKEPWCDADKLGCVGASFGGYSVYWLAGHHQKRFKAFIAHCGIFNCESMYGETEEMWFADWDYGGPYYGDAQGDHNQPGLSHSPKRPMPNGAYTDSPHKSVQKWDTPILVIHNEHDYRIPVTQGMQAFNIARMRGIDAQFLYFPDECHWVLKPQNGVLWQRVYFNWLDKYLK